MKITNNKSQQIGNAVVGEAVTDAGTWHEQIDMLGIFLTPSLQQMILATGYSLGDRASLEYETKLKGGKEKKLIFVNWVVPFCNEKLKEKVDAHSKTTADDKTILKSEKFLEDVGNSAKAKICGLLCKKGIIPFEATDKYSNATDFIDAGLKPAKSIAGKILKQYMKSLSFDSTPDPLSIPDLSK